MALSESKGMGNLDKKFDLVTYDITTLFTQFDP